MSWKSHAALVCVLAGLVLFTNLGGPRLWDRDEPRNAGCAAEMLERGDWITPVFNGELRTHKPVLLYWFMMTAYAVLGVNEFAARFWSAALGVATCLCVYAVGRRLLAPRVGLWAAIILATTLMFDVAGRAATPDSVLIFFTTLALSVYGLRVFRTDAESGKVAVVENGFATDWPFLLSLYGVMAVATLAKGPIGVLLPCAVIGVFLLGQRAADHYGRPSGIVRAIRPVTYFIETCYAMRVHWGGLIVLAIAVPWYAWVGVRTEGAWLEGFFLEHNVGRAINAMEGHGGSPIWYYPVALMAGFAPWSVFFIPTGLDAWARFRRSDEHAASLGFAVSWVAVYLGLFSLASTKLPSYITPCYPGVALLVAAYVERLSNGQSACSRYWPRISFSIWALIGVAILIGLPLAASHYLPGQQWLGAIGLIPLVGGAISLICLRLARPDAATRAFALGAFLFVWIAFSFVSVHVDRQQRFDDLLSQLQDRAAEPQLASYRVLEPSWVFYSRTTIKPVFMGEPDQPTERGGRYSGVVWVKHREQELRDYLTSGDDHFLLTTREHYDRIREQLPAGHGVVAETKYFLKDESIVAVGRTTPRVASRVDPGKAKSQ